MKKASNIFWLSLAFVGISYFIYKVSKRMLTDYLLKSNSVHIKAVVISEKNYEGNQPVDSHFTYSYAFFINDKEYKGNSHDEAVMIGDTVEIEYVRDHPDLNRPLHPKD